MDAAQRLTYMNDISEEAKTFEQRLKALLDDTWNALGSQGWMVVIAVVGGAVVGILLVWYIAKVIIALAYSVVGTATLFLGAQAALLGAGYQAVSALDARRLSLLIAFITMTAIGWVWQLFYSQRKSKRETAETQQAE
jgi:VIT1/CCC1 family predicted Fe2+/Mn2+ transporter